MWGVYLNEGVGHVMPISDLLDHSESEMCWCQPTPNESGILVHHSMDEREANEGQA